MSAITENPISYLIPMPPGRPDPKNPGKFKVYTGQKGDGNCLLYAMRIATGFTHAHIPETTWKNVKLYRKAITDLDEILYRRSTLMNALRDIPEYNSKSPILSIQQTLVQYFREQEAKGKIKQQTADVAIAFFAEYKEGSIEDPFQFESELEKKDRINLLSRFLLAEKVNLFAGMARFKAEFERLKSFEADNLKHKYHILHRILTVTLSDYFRMDTITWTPLDPIHLLLELLKDKGPLIACVSFNIQEDANLWKSEEPYEIFGGEAAQFTSFAQGAGHAIVLIGIDDNHVIYLNPVDVSDPAKKRKAYAIPYELFCNRVATASGLMVKVLDTPYLLAKTTK